jgi:hypothetical protein
MTSNESGQSKCGTCGFLSAQPGAGTDHPRSSFYEVTPEQRDEGDVFDQVLEANSSTTLVEPACLRGKRRLFGELNRRVGEQDVGGGGWHNHATVLKEMFAEDYECESWIPYTPSRSPAQHLEEFQMLSGRST